VAKQWHITRVSPKSGKARSNSQNVISFHCFALLCGPFQVKTLEAFVQILLPPKWFFLSWFLFKPDPFPNASALHGCRFCFKNPSKHLYASCYCRNGSLYQDPSSNRFPSQMLRHYTVAVFGLKSLETFRFELISLPIAIELQVVLFHDKIIGSMGTKIVAFLTLIMMQMGAYPAAFITAPRVDYPGEGQVVQGVVLISGSSNINGFQSAEVSFSHAGVAEAGGDWFLIHQSTEVVEAGTLAVWDTTTLADGDYDILVKVMLQDGRARQTIVSGVRVRNYSPIETSTPFAEQTEGPQSSATPGVVQQSSLVTPTNLPSNPAGLTSGDIIVNLARGAGIGLGLIVLVGFYAVMKRKFH
jgi:hypothetical protein